MEFLDSRRLTGPSLLLDLPGAVLDVACSADESDRLLSLWQELITRMHADLGRERPEFAYRRLIGGISLAFTAPIDALYAATEINDWAWSACAAEFSGSAAPDYANAVEAIRVSCAGESNPALLALQALARAHGTPFLWDDDEMSLGLGRCSNTWPVRDLPDPDEIRWDGLGSIPVGVITGTNGKTTTARFAAHILRAATKKVGLSSTDWIAVNERVLDRGDWSGPGGARQVLRQKDVDAAVLEVARGGLLRRGLGVERATAALITNVSEDHLGDFGSQSVDELLDIKWVVSRAVRFDGCLILNADDERLVCQARRYDGRTVWFSLDAENAVVAKHTRSGGLAFIRDDGRLLRVDGAAREYICDDAEIPISLNGAARHNVANALAAAAIAGALGATLGETRTGLISMSEDDNPGRCNLFDVRGRKVLVDFAHNPKAMQALFDMAQAIPAKRRVLCFGQAGDRPDPLIRAMTRKAWSIGLDRVIVSELANYHRGRAHGEVYAVIRDELLALGACDDRIAHHEEEVDSLDDALDWADEGDLVIMLALGAAAAIRERLRAEGG